MAKYKADMENYIKPLTEEMDLCKFGVYLALRTGLWIGKVCAFR